MQDLVWHRATKTNFDCNTMISDKQQSTYEDFYKHKVTKYIILDLWSVKVETEMKSNKV